MKKLSLLILASVSCAGPLTVLKAERSFSDFIRVEQTVEQAQLQTAITSYSKGDVTVDLIGAVHIADKAYYENLNGIFDTYEVVLFEMIAGKGVKEVLAKRRGEIQKAENDPVGLKEMTDLNGLYKSAAQRLGLSTQIAYIDYDKKHLVHADLSPREMAAAQRKRGETTAGFFVETAMAESKRGNFFSKLKSQPDSGRFLAAMLLGNKNALKMELLGSMAKGDDQVAAFAGKSTIITDRNDACLKVLKKELKKHKKVGIFYGAAHNADFEEKLLKQGFKKTGEKWIPAWHIQKKAKKGMPVSPKSEKPAEGHPPCCPPRRLGVS